MGSRLVTVHDYSQLAARQSVKSAGTPKASAAVRKIHADTRGHRPLIGCAEIHIALRPRSQGELEISLGIRVDGLHRAHSARESHRNRLLDGLARIEKNPAVDIERSLQLAGGLSGTRALA